MKNIQLKWINKKKIHFVFNEHFEDSTRRRLQKLKPFFTYYDLIVPVEKDPIKDIYYAVGGLHKLEYLYNDSDKVLCIIEEYTDSNEQLLKICRRLSNLYRTSPKTKVLLIDEFNYRAEISRGEILLKTLITNDILNKYNYQPNIPDSIRIKNENREKPISRNTINKIYQLKIEIYEKEFLVDKAEKGLLTQQHIASIEKMIREIKEFNLLNSIERIKALSYILNFPAMIQVLWKKHILDLLKKQGNDIEN